MKNNLTLLFYFLLFSTFQINITTAATITWNGNSASWEDPSQWDTGTVPTFGDDVIIPSGTARIYSGYSAKVRSVHVENGAYLRIYSGGVLSIDESISDGLYNEGRVYVYGDLGITNTNDRGIFTNNYFYAAPGSNITTKTISGAALENGSSGYFYNRGTIDMYDLSGDGIINNDRFRNNGEINIEVNVNIDDCILNLDDFRNFSNGEINIEDGDGIQNGNSTNTSAHIRNYGGIFLHDSFEGLNNLGVFTNYDGAVLEVDNPTFNGIINQADAEIFNFGEIVVNEGFDGVLNRGYISNSGDIQINYPSFDTYTGVNGSYFGNRGTLTINSSGFPQFELSGIFENDKAGTVAIIDGRCRFFSTSEFTNNGFFLYKEEFNTISFSTGAVFTNNGVVEDLHQNLDISNVDNQQVIVNPYPGPMQINKVAEDVLEVDALDNVTIGDWYVSNSTTSAIAGVYNENNNTFIPNNNALGLTYLYIYIEIDGGGNSKLVPIKIDGGITNFRNNNQPQFFGQSISDDTLYKQDITVFPNPSSGFLQIESPLFEAGNTNVEVLNTLGQLVFSQQVAAGSQKVSLNLPVTFSDGVYLVRIIRNGTQIGIQRIKLQRA